MAEAPALEKYLTPEAFDLVVGRALEKTQELKDEFRETGIVIIPACMSEAGLAETRKHFDALGVEIEMPNPAKSVQDRHIKAYAAHACQDGFVRSMMEDPRFIGFLARVTGRPEVKIRKANVAIRFKKDAPTPPWHFDGPRVSLVIPIDAPTPGSGGGFGYFSMLRRRGEPAWLRTLKKIAFRLRLHRLYRKPHIVPYAAGSIILFDGDTTYHRAMRLRQASLRRSLLLFYNDGTAPDDDDGMMM